MSNIRKLFKSMNGFKTALLRVYDSMECVDTISENPELHHHFNQSSVSLLFLIHIKVTCEKKMFLLINIKIWKLVDSINYSNLYNRCRNMYYVNSSDVFWDSDYRSFFSCIYLYFLRCLQITCNYFCTRPKRWFWKKKLLTVNSLQATVNFLAYHFRLANHRFSKFAIVINFPPMKYYRS